MEDINNPFENEINNEFVDTETGEIFQDYELEDIIEPEIEDIDDFDSVITLSTLQTDGLDNMYGGSTGVSNYNDAEYNQVEPLKITEKQTKLANKFVTDITKFITKLGDVDLNEQHKNYIKVVGNLKISNLTELLTMREMNKSIMVNLVNSINSTNGEDIMVIQSYNSLLNTQMKLIKETDQFINAVPTDIKKLRNDVLTQEQLEKMDSVDDSLLDVTNQNVHNNTKQLLMQIKAKKEADKINQHN